MRQIYLCTEAELVKSYKVYTHTMVVLWRGPSRRCPGDLAI